MRSAREVRADLDVLNEATKVKLASLRRRRLLGLDGDAQETIMQEIRDNNAKRRWLEAELVEARQADEVRKERP